MKISIVTPNYNGAQFLEATIRSVLLQKYPKLEYIVIDGGSTDGSAEILKKYEPWLHYWVSEPDLGQPNAINKGLLRCTGDIVAFINSDDTYVPGAFDRVADVFANDERVMWVAGGCEMFEQATGRSEVWSAQEFTNVADFIVGNPAAQPSIFLRSEVIAKLGPFREDLHYSFDHEYWVRMAVAGMRPVLIDAVLSRFRWHANSKTCSALSRFTLDDIAIAKRYAPSLASSEQSRVAQFIRELHNRQGQEACLRWLAKKGNCILASS